jgi:hypothetical protein
MLRSIDISEYQTNARNALIKLYGVEFPDPFDFDFFKHTEKSTIIFYYPGYFFNERLEILKIVAKRFGDQGFFLSDPGQQNITVGEPGYLPNWYVSFDDTDNYEARTLASAYQPIHYSPQGIWGVVATDEGLGILSGCKVFVDDFYSMFPEIEKSAQDFLGYWKTVKTRHPEVSVSWVANVMKNVYGVTQAKSFLSEAGWH